MRKSIEDYNLNKIKKIEELKVFFDYRNIHSERKSIIAMSFLYKQRKYLYNNFSYNSFRMKIFPTEKDIKKLDKIQRKKTMWLPTITLPDRIIPKEIAFDNFSFLFNYPRDRILLFIKLSDKKVTITDVSNNIGKAYSTTHDHISILENSGVIRRDSKKKLKLNFEMKSHADWIKERLDNWNDYKKELTDLLNETRYIESQFTKKIMKSE